MQNQPALELDSQVELEEQSLNHLLNGASKMKEKVLYLIEKKLYLILETSGNALVETWDRIVNE